MKKLICIITTLLTVNSFSQLVNELPLSGPVGIGTSAPEAGNQLTVNGNAKFQNTVEVEDDMIVNGQAKLYGVVRMHGLSEYAGLTSDLEIIVTDPSGSVTRISLGDLVEATLEPLGIDLCMGGDVVNPRWYNGVNKLFTPCPEVNVGIGTSDPNHKLTVKGIAAARKFLAGNSLATTQALINGFAINNSTKLIQLGKKIGALDEEIRFTINNDGSMVINKIGNTPSITVNNGTGHAIVVNNNEGGKIFQLENNGLLRARRIKVDNVTWADYVFSPNYKRMSLFEIEAFINTNGHLPNIPSAKEIEKDGLDIANMQKLQMEKIEELTLHLIEMDKRMNEIQKENTILKKEMECLNK